ncbi:hypothetical protein [Parapedobacter tibetensis]|uniref:hypothetical protein n=1 Tax=Parapedobacter tibetensis TaxID=2972951 RepID=UPI00214D966D|nr:hypothetical protein [Parapedobacter tibetensis]
MKYQRAKAGFFRYADSELLVTVGRIVRTMKASTVFTDPKPSLEEVEVAYADYQRKVIDAAGAGVSILQPSMRFATGLLYGKLGNKSFYGG